jgi:hypothetical protein
MWLGVGACALAYPLLADLTDDLKDALLAAPEDFEHECPSAKFAKKGSTHAVLRASVRGWFSTELVERTLP